MAEEYDFGPWTDLDLEVTGHEVTGGNTNPPVTFWNDVDLPDVSHADIFVNL